MDLNDILVRKKRQILERWFKGILDVYPVEASGFIRQEKDRFLNPVGFIIRSEMENIFDEVSGAMDTNRLNSALENILKISAVQGFAPSEAISFIFALKGILAEEIMKEKCGEVRGRRSEVGEKKSKDMKEMLELEARMDRVALQAFDIYVRCRDKINEIRTRGIKTVTH